MTERLDQILARLERVRRDVLVSRTAFAALVSGSALLAIALLVAFTSRLGHGSAAIGLLFWLAAVCATMMIGSVVRRNRRGLDSTALLCEAKFPVLNDGLISVVQLGRMMKQGKPDFSLTLFERH